MSLHRSVPRLLLFLLMAGAVFARPPPIIPMEAVPEDMPPEVRKHVLRLYGPNDEDCIEAVSSLRALGPAAAPAAPFLAGILHDEVRHGPTANLAVDALVSIGKPSIEPVLIMLQFGGAYARMRGFRVLGVLKDERGIPPLVSMIADNPGGSSGVLDLLRDYGQPALDYLLHGLKSENPMTRRNSACALPAFPTTNTIELLSAALSDPDIQVGNAAREALLATVQRAPGLVIPANDATLRSLNDSDPFTRRLGIRLLMRTAHGRKTERVAAMATDADSGVQQEVILAIGALTNEIVDTTLVGLVKSPNPAVSAEALNVLANRGSTNVIPILVELLGSPNAIIREGAVAKLSACRSTNTADILLTALHDTDPLVRTRATRAFADIRDWRFIAGLKTAVGDQDKGVRLEAVGSLAAYYLGNAEVGFNLRRSLPATVEIPLYAPAVREALIEALRDREVRVRELALYTLTAHNTPLLPTNVLLGVLSDRESHLRCHALGQLGRFKTLTPLDPVRTCLKDRDQRVRSHAIRVLGQLRDQESLDMIVAAATEGRDEARAAAEVLANFGESAIPALTKALKHADNEVRHLAAGALASMKNPKADEALRSASQDDSSRTREAATRGLQRLTPAALTPETLVNLVINSPDGRGAYGIRSELLSMGAKAIPFLLPAVEGTNAAASLAAAGLLSEIKDPAVIAPLIRLASNPDPVVRVRVIENLARTCQTNAVAPAIRKALTDPHPDVREAAATAVGQLRDRGAVAPLAAALQDSSWHTRMAASENLGRIQDASGTDALLVALADSQWQVRRTAAVALGQIRDTKSVPALTNMLNDVHWSVRLSAAVSLKAITGQSFGSDIKAWQDWLRNPRPAPTNTLTR